MRVSAFGTLVGVLLALLAVAPAAPARPFEMGFSDGVFRSPDAQLRGSWLDRAVTTGADSLDVTLGWGGVAPTRPARPQDPADPAYRWTGIDATVTDAAARGLPVLLGISQAPAWAEGPDRPASAAAGTWRPDPAAYGSFARAVAQRFSGTYTPPGATAPLPRVRAFRVWGEPNLALNLSPQWSRSRGKLRMASPARFRRLLNAAYAGIKAVHADNLVGAAGTAPYGDLDRGGDRIPPLAFTRAVLCLDTRLRRTCRSKARFDAWAHDPYSVGAPRRRALNRDDASIADMGKFAPVLRAGVRRRTALPRRTKGLWVAEVAWDSSPPDPDGVPAAQHARWLSEAMYILWRAKVTRVFWFQIRDAEPTPSFGASYQTGVFLRDGTPKPAQQSFRFPFVVDGRRFWGRSPEGAPVSIERQTAGTWRTVARAKPGQGRVFTGRLGSARPGSVFRAVSAGETSLGWRAGG